ncbi:hypothetical protein E2C01_013269 [Portunus trituberculatus]|uniref:Uncharacterized protein n=1 Tax=Portunus trituberculatus TaxID=210409 RepID=A0A5B7DGM4_PORTR|nr:hypothetical protein [Portunus trituberculatus]
MLARVDYSRHARKRNRVSPVPLRCNFYGRKYLNPARPGVTPWRRASWFHDDGGLLRQGLWGIILLRGTYVCGVRAREPGA